MITRKGLSPLLLCFSTIWLGILGCAGTPPVRVFLTPSAPQTIDQGQSLNVAATAPADTTNSGVTWSISPATGAGTLSNTTITSAVYVAPAIVTAATTATLTAASVNSPNRSSSLTITVEPPPAIPAATLPSGNQGSPYTATVNAKGGIAPYLWSVASGSLPAGLSLQASNGNSVTITGTPTALGTSTFTLRVTDGGGLAGTSPSLSITINKALPLQITTTTLPNGAINAAYSATLAATGGVLPYTWTLASGTLPPGLKLAANGDITGAPTTAGTSNFTVTVTDSATPAANAKTASLSITISSSNALKGNYAFEFQGNDSKGLVVAGGSFTADGLDHITSGVEDFNTIGGRRFLAQSFTGTYTLGADNRGTLIFTGLTQGATTYAFSIDPTAAHGRLIEFDSTGLRGSGQIEKQSVATCSAATLNGNFAFGMSGFVTSDGGSSPGPLAFAGSFVASGGAISQGEADINLAGVPTPTGGGGLNGTYAAGLRPAFCTVATSSNTFPFTFSAYPVSASEFFLVETDTISAATPTLMAGKLLQQVGAPFGNASVVFTANSVAGLVGQVSINGGVSYVPDDFVANFSPTGGTGFKLTAAQNVNGVVNSNFSDSGSYSIDTFGRVTFSFDFVMYIINTNQAFFVSDGPDANGDLNAVSGEFDPQTATTLPAQATTFVLGTLPPSGLLPPATDAMPDFSGFFTATGTSVTGIQDTNLPAGNTPNQTIAGAFSNLNTTVGSADYTQTKPTALTGSIFVVSPTKFVMLTTTTGDPNPVVIVFGN